MKKKTYYDGFEFRLAPENEQWRPTRAARFGMVLRDVVGGFTALLGWLITAALVLTFCGFPWILEALWCVIAL